MTSWYHAICHEHREVCSVFVCGSNTGIGPVYPDNAHEEAKKFLAEHYTCRLELSRDDNCEWPPNYKNRTPP